MAKTLFDKIWDQHVVKSIPGGRQILFIDHQFIHEVTSPQAFEGLRRRGLGVYDTNKITATADHNVPTVNQHLPIVEPLSKKQVDTLENNCQQFNLPLFGLGHEKQGIVHVIGPEQGITQPGMTIVCGDSHTSTHGAFGCVAFGIGTSQVEQVLASQCLVLQKPKRMRITVEGKLSKGTTAKDVILYIISQLGTGGATGYFVEYAGSVFTNMSMEERMTVCNMSIEMGARGGLIAPDETTIDYLRGRPNVPKGKQWVQAVEYYKTLFSDQAAQFDLEYSYDAQNITPRITYGTNPGMGIGIDEAIPMIDNLKALKYMGLEQGETLIGKEIQYVFIGSCTNSRIEDLRSVASFVQGKKKADHVNVWVVPGSKKVETQAVSEGLDQIFLNAGFEFRAPGCSACLGMNEDKIPAGKYCVSTSNRNFEGRQGKGSRTILASPMTAAACAIEGKIVDVRKWLN